MGHAPPEVSAWVQLGLEASSDAGAGNPGASAQRAHLELDAGEHVTRGASTYSSSEILAAIERGRLRVGMRDWVARLVHAADSRAEHARDHVRERSDLRRGVVRLVLDELMADRPGLALREAVSMTRRRAQKLPPFDGDRGPALAIVRKEGAAWFAENRSSATDMTRRVVDDGCAFSSTARST